MSKLKYQMKPEAQMTKLSNDDFRLASHWDLVI